MLLVCGLMCIVSMCCLLIFDGEFVLITTVVPDARIVFVLVAPLLLLLPSIFRCMTLATVQGRAVSFAEHVYMFYLSMFLWKAKV